MRYAFIKENIVVNIIVWDGNESYTPPDDVLFIHAENAGIGDIYDPETETFTRSE